MIHNIVYYYTYNMHNIIFHLLHSTFFCIAKRHLIKRREELKTTSINLQKRFSSLSVKYSCDNTIMHNNYYIYLFTSNKRLSAMRKDAYQM